MKNKFIKPLIFLTLLLLILVACASDEEAGGNADDNTTDDADVEEAVEDTPSDVDLSEESISLITGSETGSVYPMGVQVADYLSGLGAVATNTSGSAISNVELVERGENDIGHTSTAIATLAGSGAEPFEEEVTSVRSIATLTEMYFQFVVLDELEIDSIAEIAEQQYPLRLGVRQPGSESELAARLVLEAYGITYDDIEEWGGRVEFGSNADITNLLRDGHIEAGAVISAMPAPAFTEIDFQEPMRALHLSDEVVDTLTEYGFVPSITPDDTYSGQIDEGPTVATPLLLIAHEDTSDEVVYEIARYVSDVGIENLAAINVDYEEYLAGPEATSQNLGLPIHPGAEQYFKDAGVLE